ncbi:hypothetical protein FKM82_018502 [Ascaphus truei]
MLNLDNRYFILYLYSLIDPEEGKQKKPLRGKFNSFLTPRIGNRINPWINILPMFTYLVYPCIPFPSKKMSNLFLNKSIVSAITVSMGNESHTVTALTVKNPFLYCW